MRVAIRQAAAEDTGLVSSVLMEAAAWLQHQGMAMWRDNELVPERIAADVAGGLFFIGECGGEAAGVIKFQLEDPLFWPDVTPGESVFVHRLAVRRRHAGRGVSTGLLDWAVARARDLGRRFVRLDCEAARPKLRAVYERYGFRHHSDRLVEPYFVSRYEYEIVAPQTGA